jgi:tetratricopeptide (TPR) repeat protein
VPLRLHYRKNVKPGAQAKYDEARRIWDRSGASRPDLQKAAALLSDALKEDNKYGAAALLLCRVQSTLGDPIEALKNCRQATRQDENSVEARIMYGVMLLQTGDAAESVRELQKAAIQSPDDSFVHSVLAEALIQVDRFEDAEKSASQALARNPSSAQGFLLRGEARLFQNKLADAVEDYQQSLRLSDFRSGTLRTVAFWAVGHGMTKHRSGRQALHRTQKAVAYFGLCSCEFGRKNFLRAGGYCELALKEDKTDPDTYILLGQNYLELFNRDNRREFLQPARQNLEQALTLQPEHERKTELKSQIAQIRELLPVVR